MATAKKLPSGSWRVQASATIDGRQIRRSFTAKTAKKAEAAAEEWLNYYKIIGSDHTRLTVKDAILLYCENNKSLHSPSTRSGYMRIANNEKTLPGIMNKQLYTLTCPIIKNSMSIALKDHSPKTIQNRYGLLRTILSTYHPSFIWAIKYPKKMKPLKPAISDKYIKDVFSALKGTDFELEAYLGMLSLRASEIGGLMREDYDKKNGTLHICRAKLKDENKKYVIVNRNKTPTSTRIVYLPKYVCTLMDIRLKSLSGEYISTINPDQYWKKLNRILNKNNIEGMSFHTLRHIYSSVSSKLGIDTQIRMDNGGWSDERIMNGNYRHPISEAQKEANVKMNNYVNILSGNNSHIHAKMHTGTRKRLKLKRFAF